MILYSSPVSHSRVDFLVLFVYLFPLSCFVLPISLGQLRTQLLYDLVLLRPQLLTLVKCLLEHVTLLLEDSPLLNLVLISESMLDRKGELLFDFLCVLGKFLVLFPFFSQG